MSTSGSGPGQGGFFPLPAWVTQLKGVAELLTAFGKAPVGFILGTVLSVTVGGIEVILTTVLGGIRFVFLGSDPAGPTGRIGLADVPTLVGETVLSLTTPAGAATTDGLRWVVSEGITFAEAFGPLAPVLLAAEVSLVAIAAAWVVRTAVEVAVDVIPGGGAFI